LAERLAKRDHTGGQWLAVVAHKYLWSLYFARLRAECSERSSLHSPTKRERHLGDPPPGAP